MAQNPTPTPPLPPPPLETNQRIWPLTAEVNAAGHLAVGGCDLVELAKQYGTPLYVIDEAGVRTAARGYVDGMARCYPGDSLVIYASKAWNMLALCALMQQEGVGIDVVSGGELATALQAGVDPTRIYFHGNNKSDQELAAALAAGITLVVDNWLELETLHRLTLQNGQAENGQDQPGKDKPRIMLRLTPGIECHTHDYIRTGHLDSKFGFDPDEVTGLFDWLLANPQLQAVGLHAHIGSQIFELQPHRDLANGMVELYARGRQLGLPFSELNIGGGLGICYTLDDDPPAISVWVETVAAAVAAACDTIALPYPKLICEPGRSLIGSSGITVYQVGARKTVPNVRTYVSVDGGMSDNPRPITYGASYSALLANRPRAAADELVTVAGKHCESGDVLLRDVMLPTMQAGDLLVVFATGAYNASMASNYNRLPRPAAVMVRDGQSAVVMVRETVEDLLRQDRMPPQWQKA